MTIKDFVEQIAIIDGYSGKAKKFHLEYGSYGYTALFCIPPICCQTVPAMHGIAARTDVQNGCIKEFTPVSPFLPGVNEG